MSLVTKQKTITFLQTPGKDKPEYSDLPGFETVKCSAPSLAIELLIRRGYHIDCLMPTLYTHGIAIAMATIVVTLREDSTVTIPCQ